MRNPLTKPTQIPVISPANSLQTANSYRQDSKQLISNSSFSLISAQIPVMLHYM